MSQFEDIIYSVEDGAAIITINRPERYNAFRGQTVEELIEAFRLAWADNAVRSVILTGAGEKAFVAGADIGEMAGMTPVQLREFSRQGQALMTRIERLGKPVIAAINGFVAGPGFHFMLDADICIAVPEATFFDAHMHRTGSVPVFEPIEMSRKIPAEAVSRLFLLGPHDPLTAERAERLGLISEIVPRERLMARAMEMAQQIAQLDMNLTTAFVEANYKARELGVTEAINRGLIIRQATGYHDAPLKDRPLGELAVPGSKL